MKKEIFELRKIEQKLRRLEQKDPNDKKLIEEIRNIFDTEWNYFFDYIKDVVFRLQDISIEDFFVYVKKKGLDLAYREDREHLIDIIRKELKKRMMIAINRW